MEKYSTGIRNAVLSSDDLRTLVKNGKLLIYSGSQPTDADSAVSGTLLCSITQAGGTPWDDELRSAGSIVFTTWDTGDTITSVTVATVEILGSTLAYTDYATKILIAAATATAINKYNPLGIKAVSDGIDKVTLYAPYGVSPVTWAVASTEAGGASVTDEAFNTTVAGDAPANGLQYDLAASGAIAQSGVWSGVVSTAGTAGWFRIVGSEADAGGASVVLPRIDGTITSTGGGGDITLTSTALALSAPITLTGVQLEYEATGK